MTTTAISGGGIAGLLLALSFHYRLGIKTTVYEQAPAYCNISSIQLNSKLIQYNLIETPILIVSH